MITWIIRLSHFGVSLKTEPEMMTWVELIWKVIFAIEVGEQGEYERKEEKATKDRVTDLIECGKLGPKPNQTIWRTSRRDLRNVTSHEVEIKLVVYWLSLPLLSGSLLGTLTSPSHFRTVAVTDLTGLPLLCREILGAKKEMLNGNAVSWHNARNVHFRYMEIS